jgi:pectate lyase
VYADRVKVLDAIDGTFASGGSGDKWVGAMTRYSGDSNYYDVSLRKVVDGAIGVLATATMPMALNHWYSLRLEAVGSRLRAYVNGTLALEATDSALASGKSGMVTYRAAAQFKQLRTVQP